MFLVCSLHRTMIETMIAFAVSIANDLKKNKQIRKSSNNCTLLLYKISCILSIVFLLMTNYLNLETELSLLKRDRIMKSLKSFT